MFEQVNKKLDELIKIKSNRQLTNKEKLKHKALKNEWQDLINRQDLNPYEVTLKKLPYAI